MKLHRILSAAAPAAALVLGWSSTIHAQSGQPWVGNRTIGEGAGIRSGNFEIHPGISGEVGYDSNYYQRAGSPIENASLGPVADVLRLRVTPQLSLRTLDKRIALAGDEAPPAPLPVQFEFKGSITYNELIALKSQFTKEFSDQRNLEGGAGAGLKLFPGRVWSGAFNAGYGYIVDPSNLGGFTGAFNRSTVTGGGTLTWAPGGGAFQWNLVNYQTRFTLFDKGIGVYDNGMHFLTTDGRWNFLPKTALLFDGGLGILRYSSPGLNNGENLRARIGANGLVTKHLGLLAMGGWATSFFHNDNGLVRNYDDFIGKAEAKWYFNAGTQLQEGSANVGMSTVALGYDRSFEQSYLGDFFQRDRGYAQASYFFGGRMVTTLDGGVSRINYPDFLFDGGQRAGFGETRIDMTGFAEYRVIQTVGINLTAQYDQNISQLLDGPTLTDDLSFNRFRAFLGARWFM